MATNLEIKQPIDSFDKIKNILIENKAEDKGLLIQKDTYYKYDKGLLKLREQNGSFQLIKYNRDETGKDRWSNYELLFIEGENVEEYLSEILATECVVEKNRELFLYDNTRIHLDTVKNLGLFLELETLVFDDYEDAKSRFDNVVNLLGLNTSAQIRNSYRDLILAK